MRGAALEEVHQLLRGLAPEGHEAAGEHGPPAHLDDPGRDPIPANELLASELLVYAHPRAAANQIAHHHGAARIDVEHFVEAQNRIAKLGEIAPPGRAFAPAAAFQVIVHGVRSRPRRSSRGEVLEGHAHHHGVVARVFELFEDLGDREVAARRRSAEVLVEHGLALLHPLRARRPLHQITDGSIRVLASAHAIVRGVHCRRRCVPSVS